jgi:hypothetical protein
MHQVWQVHDQVGCGHLNIQFDLIHATMQNGAPHVERQRVEIEVARVRISLAVVHSLRILRTKFPTRRRDARLTT